MKTLIAIVLVLLGTNLQGQVNLVPNGSFEEIDSCQFLYNHFNILKFWFKPNTGSSDICNACAPVSGGGHMPDNFVGFQYAQEGFGYAGIFLATIVIPNYREYIGVKL